MNSTNELMLLYYQDLELIYEKIKSYSCKKISPTMLRFIKRTLKDELDLGSDLRKAQIFSFAFENGSELILLIIKEEISSLGLHEALRDTLSESLASGGTFSYNIQSVNLEDQLVAVRGLAILEELSKFKIPKFGKKSKSKKKKKSINSGFYTTIPDERLSSEVRESMILGQNINLAKRFCYTPANILNAKEYVKEIEKIIKKNKNINYDFFDYDYLKTNNYNLILAVSQADLDQGGGIVRLTYNPKECDNKPVAIIGKGIVFDSGGLNVKPDFEGMHRDMTGSAVALGIFLSLVSKGVDYPLNCYLPITENKISRDAYRASDIITTRDGTSVEIVNTDAEGRLCLADSFIMAKEDGCDGIFDFATLTGTIPDAIGKRCAGMATNSEFIRGKVAAACKYSGEDFWNFPLPTYIMEQMQSSELADIKQSLNEEDCDHIVAAHFLSYFAKGTSWAHMDLSCEYLDGGLGLSNTNVTAHGLIFGYYLIKSCLEGLIEMDSYISS